MRWSLGSTALLLALAAGTHTMAAEPADPAFGTPVARPGIWSSRMATGFLSGNHVRPVSLGAGGGEIAAGEGYCEAAVEGGYVYGPGSCDDSAPCVDHLWDGYVKRPHRCHLGHGHRHGCRTGLCGAGWSYNGLGAGCPGCGFKLKNWFGHGCSDCADDCGAESACDSGSCGGGLGLFKHHGRATCDPCESSGLGHRFKHGGLGRFWAACFGDNCGCDGAIDGCGCSEGIDAKAAIVPGPVGPAKPIQRGYGPTPAQAPHGEKGSLELNEQPLPPAPLPEPEKAEEKEPMEAKESTKEAAYRRFPSYRGFGSFGL
jgi:hypothetical protein